MAKKKVFVSYDHSEDARYKYLLQAWNANLNFEFEFDNRSVNVAINSYEGGVIKAALTKKMKEATHLLVIVGAKTATSQWVNWEIDRAKQSDVRLKLAAVKLSSLYLLPSGLLSVGTSLATAFEEAKIIAALNSAANNY